MGWLCSNETSIMKIDNEFAIPVLGIYAVERWQDTFTNKWQTQSLTYYENESLWLKEQFLIAASYIDSIRAVSKNFRVEVKMRENYLKKWLEDAQSNVEYICTECSFWKIFLKYDSDKML